jgi:hypothetical protein
MGLWERGRELGTRRRGPPGPVATADAAN